MTAPDFAAINAAARASLSRLLPSWLPGGRREGREWVARNPKRADRSLGSFKTNLQSGAWSDFATNEAGGDPISLFAYLNDLKQGEAARRIASELGLSSDEIVAGVANVAGGQSKTYKHGADDARTAWQPIMPVPDDAPALTEAIMEQRGPQGFAPTEVFSYQSTNNVWLGSIARYDRNSNGFPAAKEFRTFVFCEGLNGRRAWRCQGFPIPRPLYGLDRLAGRPGAPALVTEGEKSADAGAKLFSDYVAVTSPNGSKSAAKADWTLLAGRAVTIWPDADEPGAQYARDVAELVRAAGAASVRIVTLPPDLPPGWDLADPLPGNLTPANLRTLLQGASQASTEGPLPLFPQLPPAEPYPVAALGPILADAAAAIARKIQVPPAMAAQSVLAAAALAAQAHADVCMPYGQTRPLSLFLVTVAASGDRKSSADNEALWPIAKWEKNLREAHAREMTDWRSAQGAWAAEKKRIEGDKTLNLEARKQKLQSLGDEPPRPLSPFLVTGDLTIEGLTKNWVQANPALGIFTAEAGTFTGGHGMSEDARLRTAAMLSEVWDGKPIKRLRALDGVTILPGRRLSMHLMIQPDAASGFLGNGTLRDQGLLSRVLVAAPASLAGTRLHRDTAPADDAAIRSYGGRLLTLLEATPKLAPGTRNELDPPALTIDADARAVLIAFSDHVERQCGSFDGLRPIADFAAKAAEHAARIAGVLAIIDSLHATTIGMAAMENALTLADWYVVEALRLQQVGHRDPKLLQADALLTWLQDRADAPVDFRSILQFGPGPLRIKHKAEEAIAVLLAHGWLIEVSQRPRRFRVARAESGV